MSTGSGETGGGLGVSNQLASLVPTFDPATDDLQIYQQKVELVTAAWPRGKITELVTRLILGCKGTAFQKLQLHHTELLTGEESAVHKLIQYLGGQWGKIALERRYEDAEQALFHTVQKADEANDSYLARADVLWSRLLSREMTIKDLQAYIVLRGSLLTAEEKKRVIMDSEQSGSLTMTKVHEAIRLLGATFFQDMTGKRVARNKIYDQATLVSEAVSGPSPEDESAFTAYDEAAEHEFIESMLQEGDPDALLISDFENAAMDTVQEDSELATAYSAYQQARHKLAEKFRNRGFFPSRPFKGKGYGGKTSGKGKSSYGGGRKSLQERIMNSNCRLCGARGHWKSECPMRNQSPLQAANNPSHAETNVTAPTTTAVVTSDGDSLPLEFLKLPEMTLESLDVSEPILANCFVCETPRVKQLYSFRGRILGESQRNSYDFDYKQIPAKTRLKYRLCRTEGRPSVIEPPNQDRSVESRSNASGPTDRSIARSQASHGPNSNQLPLPFNITDASHRRTNHLICFATHDAFGVLDLGASKTVIGSDHVASLIQSLDEVSRAKIGRCACNITFKFGNQGTLSSQHALVVPVGSMHLKTAVVPGGTPFLVSNTFMRAIRASIDCFSQTIASPMLNQKVPLELTTKGLFLVNLNDIIRAAEATPGQVVPTTKLVQETFLTTSAKNEQISAGNIKSVTSDTRHENTMTQDADSNKSHTSNETDTVARDKRVTPVPEVDQSLATETVQAQSCHSDRDSPSSSTLCHGSDRSPEEFAGDSQGPLDGSVRLDSGTNVSRKDHVWSEASGPHLRGSLGRSTVDQFHGVEVQQQHSPVPSQADEIHRTQSGEARTGSDAHPCAPSQGIYGQRVRLDKRPFWKQVHPAYGQAQGDDSYPSRTTNPTGWRRGTGVRDVQWRDYGLTIASERESRFPDCTEPIASDGKRTGQGHSPLGVPSRAEDRLDSEDPISEVTAESCATVHKDVNDLRQLIQQYTKELEQSEQRIRPMGKPFVLGEVFCSESSPLTQQVQNLDQQAFRHGLHQGDLSTSSGRAVLFEKICRHNPMNIWYSPICGPWSSWSALNASRSMEHQTRYQELRHANRYQIALGIVLYRHQVGKGRHFHWEQPARSLMMIHPGISEVHQHSQTCQFDMCRAGDLRDPNNHFAMKKGMQLLTTHAIIYKNLHGMTCRGDHQHQPIEGSIKIQGEWKLRTEFTEIYPRKFARMIAKLLCKSEYIRPFNWKYGMSLNQAADDPILAGTVRRPVKNRGRSNFVRSQLMTPEPLNDPVHKRRRLEGKCAPPVPMEMCQEFFQLAQNVVPRVGKVELGTDMLYHLQLIFHDKEIISAIACRGTDRTMAPPQHLVPEAAPYRRTLMIMRPSGEIKYEKEWERWDILSRRQLVRPAHPCRINITMFACDRKDQIETRSDTSSSSTQPPAEIRSQSNSGSTPLAPRDGETRQSDTTNPVSDHPAEVPEPVEVRHQDQGESFKALPKWEQNQLLHMHRNLGHPSNERFAKALQENGQRPEMVRAALELKCAVCAAHGAPKHQRPATLKPLLDFNYRIYMDGVKWTNKDGESFQFYHIVDAGTLFHVAFVAPAHTSQDVINLIHQHWINWAGAPQGLKVDSGTELNSEEFARFAQRLSINCTTTCPEAHWQNGTVERHGSFLQHMLSKVDLEIPVKSYRDLQAVLNQCTHAKNSMVVHRGYSPEIMVFGKQSRLPGSILSDTSLPAHTSVLQEDGEVTRESFRHLLKIREVARQAFHMADNSDTLRKAFLRRSCPSRGHYSKGQWVMIWRTMGIQKKGWIGPQRVIIQDANHTVWTTVGGRLYRSAPENVRLSLPEEGEPTGPDLPEDITQIQQQINRMQHQQPPMQSIPEHEPTPLNDDDIAPPNHPIEPQVEPDTFRRHSTESETIIQPDHEPEIPSASESQHDNVEPSEPNTESGDHDDALYYVCHDEACALTEADSRSYVWRCEFDVEIPMEFQHQEPSQEEAWTLLATQSKKQKTEVRLTELTPSERQEFDAAKQAEVSNWIKTETLTRMLRNQVPHDQILRCRWILTWKPLDVTGEDLSNPNTKTHKAKARIVVLGYLDPHIEEIPRDSPTLSRSSRMVILQVLASHAWQLQSFDIKAAFLQGQPQDNRLIAIDPVPELRAALQLKPDEIARLSKSAYGLIDAPYLWYCALVKELLRLGMEACPFDPCVFILREDSAVPNTLEEEIKDRKPAQGAIVGILGVHVDDGIGGGGPKFQKVLELLEKRFAFGSKKCSSFTFTGIDVTQHHDYSISMNQSNYIRKIQPISIDFQRKTQPTIPINESERGALRGLVGSLQYASTNTRPDLANRLSGLQSSINHGTIETLMEANRLLHEAKKYHDVTITIKAIPYEHLRFMVFSDVSFASHNKPNSYAGSIILATHKEISHNTECPISPLMWGSKKIQRVVTSTLSAETASLASALDQLSWLRLYWKWLHDPLTQWNKPEEALCKVEPAISVSTLPDDSDLAVTDCKSLYDIITRTAPPSCSEFRVQLVARSIKEIMKEGINLRWVHTGAQLADALTKAMEARFLRETLKHGSYKLHDESATLKERAKTRDRINWLKQQDTNQTTPTDQQNTSNLPSPKEEEKEFLGVWFIHLEPRPQWHMSNQAWNRCLPGKACRLRRVWGGWVRHPRRVSHWNVWQGHILGSGYP